MRLAAENARSALVTLSQQDSSFQARLNISREIGFSRFSPLGYVLLLLSI